MAESSAGDSLVMLTTTAKPYVFHVPAIQATPTGVPYWFRYLRHYIDVSLALARPNLTGRRGILYFRDNDSQTKLCYPLRWFTVLWAEFTSPVCFLNLLMGHLVPYESISMREGRLPSSCPQGLDRSSWDSLSLELRRRSGSHPTFSSLALPWAGEPSILSEAALRAVPEARVADDRYLWTSPMPAPAARDDDLAAWNGQVVAYSAIPALRGLPFLHIEVSRSVNRRVERPEKVDKKDDRGLYSHGYKLKIGSVYSVSLIQMFPSAIGADEPGAPFQLTLRKSDLGVSPIMDSAFIDGPYGRYEMSFELDPSRIGKLSLLRLGVEADPKAQVPEGIRALPPIVLPIRVNRRYLSPILFGAAALSTVLAFVFFPMWAVRLNIDPQGVLAKAIQSALLLAALSFANSASLKDMVKDVANSRRL